MDTIALFLSQHALVHSKEVAEGEWSLEDSVLEGLTEEQWRAKPVPGGNSIAWLVWHMARTEDVAVNLLVAGRRQVLHEEGWIERLKIRHDIGTSMNDEEVAEFSSQADIAAIVAYRHAVGRRTREVVQNLHPEELSEPVNQDAVASLIEQGAIVQGASRIVTFWGDKTKGFILNMPATGHNFMHLAEAISIRRQLRP
jgi:uncharacterized damage-inducible protein DinB